MSSDRMKCGAASRFARGWRPARNVFISLNEQQFADDDDREPDITGHGEL